MKISPKALGLSFGTIWGISLLFLTLLAFYTDYARHIVEMFVGVYPYYEISVQGSFVGLVVGFIDGLIVGLLIGWVYNLFAPGRSV